jgi:hypothetical protein
VTDLIAEYWRALWVARYVARDLGGSIPIRIDVSHQDQAEVNDAYASDRPAIVLTPLPELVTVTTPDGTVKHVPTRPQHAQGGSWREDLWNEVVMAVRRLGAAS